jgi:hypothetical protein
MRIAVLRTNVSLERKASNVQCTLGLRVRAVLRAVHGFAAPMTEFQAVPLANDQNVVRLLRDPSTYVVSGLDEAGTAQLERDLGFAPDFRYDTRTLKGFAAVLDWSQLAALNSRPDLAVTPDPWVYIVFYADGVDVEGRTNELARRYGFTPRFRYDALGGFSAELTAAELGGIASEPDIVLISPNHYYGTSIRPAYCAHSLPRLRRHVTRPALTG